MSTVYTSITSLQDAIYDWLAPIVSPRQIIWRNQKAPQPTSAYYALDITSLAIAEGNGMEIQVSGSQRTLVQRRHAVLNLQSFGAQATESLFDLKSFMYLESSREALTAANLAVLNDEDVLELSALIDTDFQERASMDLLLGYTRSDLDGSNWIEIVEVTDTFGDTTIIDGS